MVGRTNMDRALGLKRAAALVCVATGIACATAAVAQTAAPAAKQQGPPAAAAPAAPAAAAPAPASTPPAGAGSVGNSGWTGSVEATKSGNIVGIQLDEKQMATIKGVSTYFNGLKHLKGSFVQTTADNKRLRWQFFVMQPGRFRFDYAKPSLQVIVSDGNQVAIQDNDINTDDRLALNDTPMRVLLRRDVDLVRDARIFDVQETADLVMVVLQDKSAETNGRIKLFLGKSGTDLELKEWVTTDAQGLDTRLEVSNLVKSEEIDTKLFVIQSIGLKKLEK